MKENIIIEDKRALIQQLGTELFEKIINLPYEIRFDEKPRTGIQIVTRAIYPEQLVMTTVKKPSERALFYAVEKTVRTESFCHATSADSADPERGKHPGCVIYLPKEEGMFPYHVSVSGLKSEEDVAIALIILSRIIDKSVSEVTENIMMAGEGMFNEDLGTLPEEIFDKQHYLYKLLQEYE